MISKLTDVLHRVKMGNAMRRNLATGNLTQEYLLSPNYMSDIQQQLSKHQDSQHRAIVAESNALDGKLNVGRTPLKPEFEMNQGSIHPQLLDQARVREDQFYQV